METQDDEARRSRSGFLQTLDRWGRGRVSIWILAATVGIGIYAQAAFYLFTTVRTRDSYSYYYAAVALRKGLDPYDRVALNSLAPDRVGYVMPYLYPPAFAQAWSPLIALSPEAAHSTVVAVSTLLALLNVAILWSLLPRPPHQGVWLLAFLALHAVCGPVVSAVRLGQITVLLGTLIFGSLALERARHSGPAGALFSLACLTKVTPVLFVFDLIARRRWLTIASFTGVTLLLVASSVFTIGPEPWRRFLEIMAQPKPFEPLMSMHGLLAHAFGKDPSSAWALEVAWGVSALALFLVVVWLLKRDGKNGDPVKNWSVLTLFGLLASPMTWHHHYYLALLPFSYLVFREQTPRLRAIAVAVALLALFRYPGSLHYLKPLCAIAGLALLGLAPHPPLVDGPPPETPAALLRGSA